MMTVQLDSRELVSAFARLKNIPVWKVIRNAAKDFTRGAYDATPVAKKSTSPYYRAKYKGRTWYVKQSQLTKGTRGKMKALAKGEQVEFRQGRPVLKRVLIKKGWSKSTWIGAMRTLGFHGAGGKYATYAASNSLALGNQNNDHPEYTVVDQFHIDAFGRSTTDEAYARVVDAGWTRAAAILTRSYRQLVEKEWRRK